MKKRFLFLLLVLSALGVFPQNSEDVMSLPDSLVMQLKENRNTDEARAEALDAAILFYFEKHRILEAEPYINDLSVLAKELKNNYWIAVSNYYIALCDLENKSYSEAFAELNDVLKHVETLRLSDRTRLLLGRVYLAKSAYFFNMNMFPESYETIQNGLKILKGTKSAVRPRLLNNLGNIYNVMGNEKEAIKVFKEALKEERKAGYYGNIAGIYNKTACYDSALIYADSALLVSHSLYDSLFALHFKGIICCDLGKLDAAEQLYEECLERTRLDFDPHFLYLNSLIYQNASSIAADKGDFPKALCLLEKGLQISNTIQDDDRIAECIKLKAQILNSMHNYEKAIKCMLEYDSIRDVVLVHQNRERVNEIIHQQETRVLEQQYETERKIIGQRQQYIIIIAVFIVVFVAVIVFFIVRDKRLKETLLKQELDLRNREITSKTMSQMQRNEVLDEVIEKLTHLENNPKGSGNSLPMVIRELKGMIDDGSKKDFDYYFVQVHPDFYAHLKEDFPDLTPNELRLCALVKANLNIKEIANLNNVSIDSVKSSRKRLRKSLGISDPNVDLAVFLSKY